MATSPDQSSIWTPLSTLVHNMTSDSLQTSGSTRDPFPQETSGITNSNSSMLTVTPPQSPRTSTDDRGGGEPPFCLTPLWNTNLTWDTSNPDFTACFHQSVLVYIPAVILLLGIPFQIYMSYHSKNRGIPWSVLNILKFIINIALICLPLIDLVDSYSNLEDGEHISQVHLVALTVQVIMFLITFGLQLTCKMRGQVTSGPLFLFWLGAAICGAPTFRSLVKTRYIDLANGVLPFVTYTIQYPLVLAMFFLSCWADSVPKYIVFEEQAVNPNPEQYASFLSKLVFFYFEPLAWKGWRKELSMQDLWSLSFKDRCRSVVPLWDKYWTKANETSGSNNQTKKEVSILSTLFHCFGGEFAWTSLLNLIYTIVMFASPQVVNLIIAFIETDEPLWKGYFYTALIVAATFMNTIINSQMFYKQYLIGLRVRTALTSAIYRKSLKLSNSARKEMTVGETTNLMAIDSQKFMDMTLYINMIWASPMQVALSLFFLWQILGPSALAGMVVMVLMIPLNAIIATKMKKYQYAQMKNKDKRVKLMDEILNGIKVLKLYAWESSFSNQVLKIRDGEIDSLKKSAYLNAVSTFLWTCAPFLVALSSFTAFVLSDPNNILDAQTAFVSLTLFNLLRVPLNVLPLVIVFMVQSRVSLKRINKFMNMDELDPNNVSHDEDFHHPIVAENADFSWDSDSSLISLKNINMEIADGSLVAVVGKVGTGKSSLLSALLGELKRTRGMVNVHGKIAYAPQQAWIQNSTLQYNITFGRRYNKELYNKVIEACALGPDLEMLPGGDQIEIGEKGINLSGGQKQRVSVARSVYSNSSLYLLDDPLSAVDSHVGKHMFDNVIGPNGLLKNKTRILVTHGVSYLPVMDKIIVMKGGGITEMGTYKQLLEQKGEFADFLVEYLTEKEEEAVLDPETESELEDLKQELETHLGKAQLKRKISKARSEKSYYSGITDYDKVSVTSGKRKLHRIMSIEEEDGKHDTDKKGRKLIETEKQEIGGVKWSVYYYYLKSLGWWFTILTTLFYIAFQGFSVGANIWLSDWADDPLASTDIAIRNKYLGIYGLLGFLQSFSVMFATVYMAIGTLNAASKLHSTMLVKILRSPMSFFDTTPLGRILNRFSKDIDILDTTIPVNFRMLINQALSVLGTVVVIIFAMPIFLAIVVPIGFAYYFVQRFYVATARQVKRMESISRSPIYTHFGETISGSATIRAYNLIQNFVDENENRIDTNQICYYPSFVSSRWLSVRLESIGNLIVLFAALFAVMSKGSIDPGLVGLALSYALNVTGALNMLVRMTSEVETNMVSVERIQEYQDTPQEAPFDVPENDPSEEWPEFGVVKFDNYQTRYREGLDLALKGINCDVLSGEKVGIVGRTGAGKSSLTLALFRIIEAAGGSISIDGVNISQLGLGRLRARITIIPQDPVLFSGTVRMNLDPFDQYSDKQVWTALEHAHLKSTVSNFPGGLQHQVTEGGENLSVGQRQLICLARALLRKTKVLVLDEATAAVDLETDDLVQGTIRKEFADCTVLTIAHRLNTIMDSNRVMVLGQGKILEYDSPENLMKNVESVFYGMAKDAGLTSNT